MYISVQNEVQSKTLSLPFRFPPLRAAIVPDNDCVNKNQNKFSLISLIT